MVCLVLTDIQTNLIFKRFSYEEKTIPYILTILQSRTQLVPIQLSASRCLTYLHRSGSLLPSDPMIVYKTIPCLARLCTLQFDDETRAAASETLAYLTEVRNIIYNKNTDVPLSSH